MRLKHSGIILLFTLNLLPCFITADNKSFQMTVQQKYLSSVQPSFFSPNGKYLLTVSTYTGSPKLWDMKTGLIIRNIPLGNPYNMYFSPDSQFVLISDYDMTVNKHCVFVYNIASGKIERQILNNYVLSVFSNQELAALDKIKKTVVLVNYRTGKEIKTLFQNPNNIAVSHDGKLIAECVPGSKSCSFYELKTMRKIGFAPIETGQNDKIFFSPDNLNLLVQLNWSIAAYDIKNGKLIYTMGNKIQGNSLGKVFNLCIDFAHQQLIVGYESKEIVWYNLKNGISVKSMKAPENSGYMKIAVNPEGNLLALSSANPELTVYDTNTFKGIKTLSGVYSGNASLSVAISPDGKHLVSATDKGSFKIYDIENLRLIKKINTPEEKLLRAEYSPDGKLLAVASEKHIVVFKAKNYEFLLAYNASSPFCFSRNSKYLIYAGKSGTISIINLETKKVQNKIIINEKENQFANALAVSPDGIHFAAGVNAKEGSTLYVFNQNTGKLAYALPGHRYHTDALAFSPDGKKIASGSYSHEIKLWNTQTRKEAASFVFDAWITSMTYTGDGKYLLVSGGTQWGGGRIGVFDSKTNKGVRILENHAIGVTSLSSSVNGKYFASGSFDSTEKIWKTDSFDPVTFLAMDDKNWFFYSDDGYFDSSINGGDFLMMVQELSSYSVEQFALKLNRPDILMKKIGIAGKEAVSHYENQYLKRIKKAGFTENILESGFHVPEVKLLSSAQDGKILTVSFQMTDQKYKLKSYNIYVNGVPEFSAYGKPVHCDSSNQCKLRATEKIVLNSGKNKIEIACLNERGAESFRAQTVAEYSSDKKGRLFYIGLGASQYKDSRLNLNYADKDALDLAELFKSMTGKSKFEKQTENLIYVNERVTLENISRIREIVKYIEVDDTLVLFISGHGLHDKDKENTYYYLTHETDVNRLKETAANFEVFEEILMNTKARKKLFLMDTCESGEADEEALKQNPVNGDNSFKARTAKGLDIIERQNVKSPKKSRKYLYEKDRYIYNDLLKRSGAIVFSSSKGGEYSYEDKEIQNGFFTRAILDFFYQNAKGGVVGFQAVKEFVIKTVSQKSEKLFAEGKIETPQHPTVDRDNINQVIELESVSR